MFKETRRTLAAKAVQNPQSLSFYVREIASSYKNLGLIRSALESVNSFDDFVKCFEPDKEQRPNLRRYENRMFFEYAQFFFKYFAHPYRADLWAKLDAPVRLADGKEPVGKFSFALQDNEGNPVAVEVALSAFELGKQIKAHPFEVRMGFAEEDDWSHEFALGVDDVKDFMFCSMAAEIQQSNQILFTSLPSAPIFFGKCDPLNSKFTIFGSELQREFVESDGMFFRELRKHLAALEAKEEKVVKQLEQLVGEIKERSKLLEELQQAATQKALQIMQEL